MKSIGDKVRVKSIDWYEKNRDDRGEVVLKDSVFAQPMKDYCGQEMTITDIRHGWILKEDGWSWLWSDEMFEEEDLLLNQSKEDQHFRDAVESTPDDLMSELPKAEQDKSKGKSPLEIQIGGDHYKKLPIQPVEYTTKNNLNFLQGSVIKYITRYKNKGGLVDLQKARHCIDMLIQLECLEC